MAAPPPSSDAQIWTASAVNFALANWFVTDAIAGLDEQGNGFLPPSLVWGYNVQANANLWPDESGWVAVYAHTWNNEQPASPVAPIQMQDGVFLATPTSGNEPQFRAEDNADHPAFLRDQFVGYHIDMPPVSGATGITDVLLEVTYQGPRPGVSMTSTGSDLGLSTSWITEAKADFTPGDTVLWKLINDTGSVATWRMRQTPAVEGGSYSSWRNVYYGNLSAPGGFDQLFLYPFGSVGFDDPQPASCVSIGSVRMWREPILVHTPASLTAVAVPNPVLAGGTVSLDLVVTIPVSS